MANPTKGSKAVTTTPCIGEMLMSQLCAVETRAQVHSGVVLTELVSCKHTLEAGLSTHHGIESGTAVIEVVSVMNV